MPIQKITSGIIQDGAVAAADIVSVSNTAISGTITGSQISSNTLSNTVFQTGSVENYMNAAGLGFGMRNRIINGDMRIDQRNAGASVTLSTVGNTYILDRWECSASVASKFSAQQSSTAPTGFINSTLYTSLSAYTVGAGQIFTFRQKIEGLNIADLAWGTASASTVTLSFWVRSSLTGTFGGALNNSGFARSYPFTYTISSADTWEQKTLTIAGDTSGTWLTTNGVGLNVNFGLGCSSDNSGTAGVWATADYRSATGAVSVVGTNGATFYITGVQLEKGSTATSFDYRPYGTELQLCQRYLPAFRYNSTGTIIPSLLQFNSTTTSRGFITFPVTTRVSVTGTTISSVSHFVLQSYAGGSSVPNAMAAHQGGVNGVGFDVNFGSSVSGDKNTGVLQIDNSAGYIYFTGAEL